LRVRRFASDQPIDIECRCGDHGSIMKPVFGTPTGTGVFPTGGPATQTPTEKISGNVGFCWYLLARMNPRGLDRPSMPNTASTPRNAGSIIVKFCGTSWVCLTDPSSAISDTKIRSGSILSTRALQIHLIGVRATRFPTDPWCHPPRPSRDGRHMAPR
jgi:hypothetical protein